VRVLQSKYPRSLGLLAFGPNGLIAAACAQFQAGAFVEVWDATGAEPAWSYTAGYGGSSLAFVPGGLFFGYSFGAELIELRRTNRRATVESVQTGWKQAAFAPLADRVLVGRTNLGVATLTCYSFPDIKLLWWLDKWEPHTRFRTGAATSADGTRVAFATNVGSFPCKQFVTVHDTNTGARVARWELEPTSAVMQLAYSACGTMLFARSDSRTVDVFDANTGARVGALVHPGRAFVSGIAVHPNGTIACSRTNGTVALWNADALDADRVLDWKAGRLASVAFSADGALGAAGTEDGKLIVWDVES
jgi:WD40 repeat protein